MLYPEQKRLHWIKYLVRKFPGLGVLANNVSEGLLRLQKCV